MFAVLWFLFVAFVLTAPLVWLLDHNGLVLITWFGYELRTDVLTAALLIIFAMLLIAVSSYLLTRVLAIRFPQLLKFFFRRNYTARLEKVIKRHHDSFEIMAQMLLAFEARDEKTAEKLRIRFAKLVKNPALNNFFLGKISFANEDFSKAEELFSKFGENQHAKILVLKSKLEFALQKQDEVMAIAYANQILSVKKSDVKTARVLFALYKKRGMWQSAKNIAAQYGAHNFRDELQKRDVAVINSALAVEAYQQKKFLQAIKFAKEALRAENNFLPALEITLKSWLKLGFNFKVGWKLKSLWRENPHLIFAEIFDLTNRKASRKNRIKAMKKFVALRPESALGKLALGLIAFRCSDYAAAKEFLHLSLMQQKTYRAYKILAFAERNLGNLEGFKKNLAKAEMLAADDHYTCNSCGHLSSRWSAKCMSCDAYDSLDWNN
jgi:uncharacterized membrane-anchored protein